MLSKFFNTSIIKQQSRTLFTSNSLNMIIKPVPCLKDNYSYLLLDEKSHEAAAIDPVEPHKVLKTLKEEYPDYKLTTVLTTHHHWDHAGGNKKLLEDRPDVKIYGGSSKVEGVQHIIDDEKQTIQLGQLSIQPLFTRGHTMDHVCYYVPNDDIESVTETHHAAVFTGDCLFSSGAGRFFEGTPKDMYEAFTKLVNLPENTNVYFGHEYTVSNCKFALHVDPDNKRLQQKMDWAQRVSSTTPSTILNEMTTNPFLRVNDPAIRAAVAQPGDDNSAALDDVEVLGRLRKMKDNF